jgi:phage tail-like protein
MTQEAFSNCRFYVELGGSPQAVFTEVSGLELEVDVFEYEEGGANAHVHQLPGRVRASNLTFKRGITRSTELLEWCFEVARGEINARNLTVVIYDARGEMVMRWNFENAYPVKWTGPQLSAEGTDVAIETLELAHSGLKLG